MEFIFLPQTQMMILYDDRVFHILLDCYCYHVFFLMFFFVSFTF